MFPPYVMYGSRRNSLARIQTECRATVERAAALPSDATRLERLLAYEPVCGPAHRHRAVLLRRLGRELGLESY